MSKNFNFSFLAVISWHVSAVMPPVKELVELVVRFLLKKNTSSPELHIGRQSLITF